MLIYRLVFAVYCFCWLIASGLHPSNGEEKWFIFITNWSYFFVSLYFLCSTVLTAMYYRGEWMVGEYDVQDNDVLRPKSRSRPGSLPPEQPQDIEENDYINPLALRNEEPTCWYHEALWVIYNIAAANAVTVTFGYWIRIYPQYPDSYTPDGLDISMHLLNSVFMLTDTFLSNVPVRLFHVIYAMLFYLAFVIFALIYWASDGTNVQGMPYIYSGLDFTDRPGKAAGAIFLYMFVGLVLSQLFLFTLSKLRSCVSAKINKDGNK